MSDDIHELKLNITAEQLNSFASRYARKAVEYSEQLRKEMYLEANSIYSRKMKSVIRDDDMILTPLIYSENIDRALASEIRLRDNNVPFNRAMERIVAAFVKEAIKHIQISMYRNPMYDAITVESKFYIGVRRN